MARRQRTHGFRRARGRVLDRLRLLTAPFILRRLKTDPNIIDDLPEKSEQIITVAMTPEQSALYNELVDSVTFAPEPNPRVVVVQAIPKSERADLAVDLATQAGADEIIAWQADRCVAKLDGLCAEALQLLRTDATFWADEQRSMVEKEISSYKN